MKRRIAISLLAAAVLMLAACGNRSETVPSTAGAEQTQEMQMQETAVPEAETQGGCQSPEPEYAGIYWQTWSEEIAGTVIDLNSYIVLNEDNTGYWIAQDVGTLTWNESQLILTVGATYDIALTQENDTVNLLVYEFQDDNGVWNPTVFEKIEELPAEMEEMLAKSYEADEELITLTFTSQYLGDVTDEKLQENIGTFVQSAERQTDGSVVVKMTAEQYANYLEMLRQGIRSAAQNMVANTHNNITDISFNDDFSEFQVTVKTDTLHRSDADLAYYMFTAYGRFYHYLTTYQYLTSGLEEGLEDWSVAFTYLDADGNILEGVYNPE